MPKIRIMLTADVVVPDWLDEQLNDGDAPGDVMNVSVEKLLKGIEDKQFLLENVVLEEVIGD
jgi:hypothetical protein